MNNSSALRQGLRIALAAMVVGCDTVPPPPGELPRIDDVRVTTPDSLFPPPPEIELAELIVTNRRGEPIDEIAKSDEFDVEFRWRLKDHAVETRPRVNIHLVIYRGSGSRVIASACGGRPERQSNVGYRILGTLRANPPPGEAFVIAFSDPTLILAERPLTVLPTR